MNTEVMFWFLVGTAILEAIGIYLTSSALRALVGSRSFRDKVRNLEEAEESSESNAMHAAKTLLVLLASTATLSATAQAPILEVHLVDVSHADLWVVGFINVFLLIVFWYLRRTLDRLVHVEQISEGVAAERVPSKVMQWLTDAVPVGQEHTVETDHEYDGIRELDNNLPPWWKWGFVGTIIFAAVYLVHYHVTKTGDLQIAEYTLHMEEEQAKVLAFLESQALNVDENTVTVMTEAGQLAAGAATFDQYCKVCHSADGGGKVGPNLTDEYWLYGNDIKDIFKTIKYGANRGMKSWQDELNPVQMQEVASYIRTLVGTTPADPKAPEGDLYPEGESTPDATPDDAAPEENLTTENEGQEMAMQ